MISIPWWVIKNYYKLEAMVNSDMSLCFLQYLSPAPPKWLLHVQKDDPRTVSGKIKPQSLNTIVAWCEANKDPPPQHILLHTLSLSHDMLASFQGSHGKSSCYFYCYPCLLCWYRVCQSHSCSVDGQSSSSSEPSIQTRGWGRYDWPLLLCNWTLYFSHNTSHMIYCMDCYKDHG